MLFWMNRDKPVLDFGVQVDFIGSDFQRVAWGENPRVVFFKKTLELLLYCFDQFHLTAVRFSCFVLYSYRSCCYSYFDWCLSLFPSPCVMFCDQNCEVLFNVLAYFKHAILIGGMFYFLVAMAWNLLVLFNSFHAWSVIFKRF